jgi:hypothetical protein
MRHGQRVKPSYAVRRFVSYSVWKYVGVRVNNIHFFHDFTLHGGKSQRAQTMLGLQFKKMRAAFHDRRQNAAADFTQGAHF